MWRGRPGADGRYPAGRGIGREPPALGTANLSSVLAVFHAPFREEAAWAVADAGAADLGTLELHGLLQRAGPGRVCMHPLVRAYARAKLDEFPRERTATLAAYARTHLRAVRALAADFPAVELPDLRRAWELAARDGDEELVAEAADGYLVLLASHGAWAEAERRFSVAAAWTKSRGTADGAVARLEARMGAARVALDRVHEGAPPLRRALSAAVLADDAGEEAFCRLWLARAHLRDGDAQTGAEAASRAIAAAKRAGAGPVHVQALCAAAACAWAAGARGDTVKLLYESVEVDPSGHATPQAWRELVRTGEALFRAGDAAPAAVLLSRAVSAPGAPPACATRAEALLREMAPRTGATPALQSRVAVPSLAGT